MPTHPRRGLPASHVLLITRTGKGEGSYPVDNHKNQGSLVLDSSEPQTERDSISTEDTHIGRSRWRNSSLTARSRLVLVGGRPSTPRVRGVPGIPLIGTAEVLGLEPTPLRSFDKSTQLITTVLEVNSRVSARTRVEESTRVSRDPLPLPRQGPYTPYTTYVSPHSLSG